LRAGKTPIPGEIRGRLLKISYAHNKKNGRVGAYPSLSAVAVTRARSLTKKYLIRHNTPMDLLEQNVMQISLYRSPWNNPFHSQESLNKKYYTHPVVHSAVRDEP
jgi:hypothetical protein